ncbi:hypothetical protein HYFRA_00012657 [Hymenoscyphus fraxineus]|uniref:Nuc-1 negative regulatory protein preg n=1 Tax=Hymenoscyphus fraxineus TaxID=746836 RepID=A0A9N9L929_9HELO|nr:hypothetical protein HYFRA_00012657 [Hymenoscyphus fraxineus]
MLKSLPQSRSPSSPSFHYAPVSQSQPSSPLSRTNSKSRSQAQLSHHGVIHKTSSGQRVRYVDATTQWSTPVMKAKMDPPPLSEPEPMKEDKGKGKELAVAASPASGIVPLETVQPPLEAFSPSMKRQTSERPSTSNLESHKITPKRVRPPQTKIKLLPTRYEFCEVEDMVVLIANMISELIHTNDAHEKRGDLTRFHSRTPPGISVLDYLQRLAKHATLTPPLLLSMVYYMDRLCLLYPAFTVTSLTIHRFLITTATVAAKGLSDSFWNNSTYARVGGIKVAELGLLELEFLHHVDWKIVPNPEALVDYYRALVERSAEYELEDDSSSLDDDDDEDDNSNEEINESKKPEIKSTKTDVEWKAWMDDVSTKKAENSDTDNTLQGGTNDGESIN